MVHTRGKYTIWNYIFFIGLQLAWSVWIHDVNTLPNDLFSSKSWQKNSTEVFFVSQQTATMGGTSASPYREMQVDVAMAKHRCETIKHPSTIHEKINGRGCLNVRGNRDTLLLIFPFSLTHTHNDTRSTTMTMAAVRGKI